MHQSDLESQIAAIASLAVPVRRGLYLYVAGHAREVSRDEAARALRVSRALAAFHLDKLVDQGLLEVSYRRLTPRRGPGAGRPAKLYHRSTRQLQLTLPQRRYELAGRVLVRAVNEARSPAARRALQRVAVDVGRRLGSDTRGVVAGRSDGHPGAGVLALLAAYGYEPLQSNGDIRLRNCPFESLANECRPLICRMNLALLEGALKGAGTRRVTAELDPQPGACCVVVRTTHPAHPKH